MQYRAFVESVFRLAVRNKEIDTSINSANVQKWFRNANEFIKEQPMNLQRLINSIFNSENKNTQNGVESLAISTGISNGLIYKRLRALEKDFAMKYGLL